jgi:hypothetical protein
MTYKEQEIGAFATPALPSLRASLHRAFCLNTTLLPSLYQYTD